MAPNDIKLVHKLAASFILITVLVVGLITFTYTNLVQVQTSVTAYKGIADESLSTSDILSTFMGGAWCSY